MARGRYPDEHVLYRCRRCGQYDMLGDGHDKRRTLTECCSGLAGTCPGRAAMDACGEVWGCANGRYFGDKERYEARIKRNEKRSEFNR